MKLNLTTFDLILIFITLEEWPFINHQIYIVIKYLIIIYLLIRYSGDFLKIIIKEKKIGFAALGLVLFTILSTISTVRYTNKLTWGLSALMNGMNYLAIFSSVYSIFEKRGSMQVLKIIYLILLIILVINDFLMFALTYNFDNPSEQYWVGNKFSISYYHCFLLVISKAYSIVCNSKNKRIIKKMPYFLGVFSIFVCAIVHCSTGIIISTISFGIILVPTTIKKIFCNKIWVIILLVVENIVIFGSTQLLVHPAVQSFIVNVLGKSSNFTGRFKIFAVLNGVIAKRPLLGYGFNTVTDIITSICGYGNAQNGIKQLLIQFGVIGTTLLFLALFIFAGKSKNNTEISLELYIMLFALSIAAAVEISISTLFVFVVSLIGGLQLVTYQNRRKIKNERRYFYYKNI